MVSMQFYESVKLKSRKCLARFLHHNLWFTTVIKQAELLTVFLSGNMWQSVKRAILYHSVKFETCQIPYICIKQIQINAMLLTKKTVHVIL